MLQSDQTVTQSDGQSDRARQTHAQRADGHLVCRNDASKVVYTHTRLGTPTVILSRVIQNFSIRLCYSLIRLYQTVKSRNREFRELGGSRDVKNVQGSKI